MNSFWQKNDLAPWQIGICLKCLHVFLKWQRRSLKWPHVFLKHVYSFCPTRPSCFSLSFFDLISSSPASTSSSTLTPASASASALALASALSSCTPDPFTLKPLDLSPIGIPITILAPDSSAILVKEYEDIRDITIRKHDRFNLQIFEFSPSFSDAKTEKLRQLTTVRNNPYFKQVLLDEQQGFIFTNQLDSVTTTYDFRYVRLVGDKELIFQAGLVGAYTLNDIKRMYEAIK